MTSRRSGARSASAAHGSFRWKSIDSIHSEGRPQSASSPSGRKAFLRLKKRTKSLDYKQILFPDLLRRIVEQARDAEMQ